ncbi:MAG: phosphatidylglycerol lysyltransferase domain-containing protein [Rhodobacteraceae bacterium]|nr:phosphatidylglycerol lysyltransferase domain-containing protein [Paracoccaceae bacterium]
MGNAAGQVRTGLIAIARHPVARTLPALLIGLWFASVLVARLENYDLHLIGRAFGSIPPLAWLAAGLASAVSFAAIAGYDVVAARDLGLTLTPRSALRSGFAATALAQLAGLGLVTGALVRWRMLDPARLGLLGATFLTLRISLLFLSTGAVLTAALAVLAGDLPDWAIRLAMPVLLAGLAAFVLCLLRPSLALFGRSLDWPSLRGVLAFAALVAVDLVFAALALYLLLPDIGISFVMLLPVFAFAMLAGVASGVPGGVGPFEIALLSLLPELASPPGLAAIAGFRCVFYLAPGIIAAGWLALAEARDRRATLRRAAIRRIAGAVPADIARSLRNAPRGDAMLLHEGGFDLLGTGAGWLVADCGNSLICLSEPLAGPDAAADLLHHLTAEARHRNRWGVVYKCGAETAAFAQAAGYRAHRIGIEAVLDPRAFSPDGPARRGLRRKLRKAALSGVRVTAPVDALPLAEMADVAKAWAAAHGGARGFSMGRFAPERAHLHEYLLAWQGDHLVGFIGLWSTNHEVALDLVRLRPGAPDGTAYALVAAAITRAGQEGVARFSLSAVPFAGIDAPRSLVERYCAWLYHARPAWHGAPGLYQFKAAFAPHWEPRYLLAPHLIACIAAGLDLSRNIRRPLRISVTEVEKERRN